jgi:hypothetical protein
MNMKLYIITCNYFLLLFTLYFLYHNISYISIRVQGIGQSGAMRIGGGEKVYWWETKVEKGINMEGEGWRKGRDTAWWPLCKLGTWIR